MSNSQANLSLSDYAEILIKDKNYTSLTAQMHEEMKKDIVRRLHEFLMAKTIAKLSDEGVAGLNDLLDKNATDEQIQTYIATQIDDAPTFIGDVLFEFRQTFMGYN